MADRVASALVELGSIRAMVFFGHDGLDELTTSDTSTVLDVRAGAVTRSTVEPLEFGLAREGGELKILGAGLASSFGEAHFSLESEAVERLPFSVRQAVRTAYRNDVFQPLYLVSESVDSTVREILGTGAEELLAIE